MIKADERTAAAAVAGMATSVHGGGGETVNSGGGNVLPKCCCTWKNCRAYQKAWREAKHAIFDGVVKVKLVRDHPESMALKACIDRALGVPESKSTDWKAAKKQGQPDHVKYIVARHHFTEKHIQKYLQDPKNFSFLKPFSVHGANKYLYAVNRNDTLATANANGEMDDAELLYLQCPSVPKDVVKEEFYRVMEKVKASKKSKQQQQQQSSSTMPKKSSKPAVTDEKSDVASSLHHKEVENRILKDQLDAMKSQLTFLHDMVQKLQEQHFDHQSVHTGRSSKYQNSRHSRKPRSGVPHEIELGEDGDETFWNEPTEGDWTDNYNSESNRDDDDDDDERTTSTFQVTYRASRHGSACGGSVASKAASTIVSASKSVKTLPREIELDEDEDDSESHESLEEEAFDNRSFASSHYGAHSVSRNGAGDGSSRHSRASHRGSGDNRSTARSFVSDNNRRPSKGPSAMNASTRKSIGPNSKKPSRRVSNGESATGGGVGSSSQARKMSGGTCASETSHETGTYEVTAMVVTDPYGEKGSYTGSISSSTGMPNGYGRLEYDKAGRWYEGDWKHGRWTGRGRLSNGDGDFYEGGLKNDHKHGIGKMKFADGRTFDGEYINGQMVEGKMTYQDGSTYAGSWVDGMRHGRGRCVFTDESIYEGEFKEGEFFGRGKMTWNDGGWYEGEWLNGDMHGRGREVRADGSLRHDGEWLKGQPIRNKK
jgi:hypothetical protein